MIFDQKTHIYIRRLKWQKLLFVVQIDQFSSKSIIWHPSGVYIYIYTNPDTLFKNENQSRISYVKSMVLDRLCFPMSNHAQSFCRPRFRITMALIPNTSNFHRRFTFKLDLEIDMSQTLPWLCLRSKFHHFFNKNDDLT